MPNKIDHVVIGAGTLEQGVSALAESLGAEIPRGGKHPMMSTHNCVAQAGPDCFFEIISIDPEAPPPGRRRWFSLDETATQSHLAQRPRALCWVVATDDLDAIVAKSPVDLGEVLSLSRDDLTWRLTVPADGSLALGGLLPGFIQWPPGPHPSQRMKNLDLHVRTVRLEHPEPQMLSDMLRQLGIEHLAEVAAGPAALSFVMDSPRGRVTLD